MPLSILIITTSPYQADGEKAAFLSRAAQLITLLSKLQYGQVQYPNHRSCNKRSNVAQQQTTQMVNVSKCLFFTSQSTAFLGNIAEIIQIEDRYVLMYQ